MTEYKWNGVGHFYHGGHYIMQSEAIIPIFTKFFAENKFDTIIEIGTANGGFSLMLEEFTKDYGTKIFSYDINEIPEHIQSDQFKSSTVDFRVRSAHEDGEAEIAKLIRNGGKVAVFCDGGDKVKEINLYCKHLKKGDFIFAHDYAVDTPYYLKYVKGKLWDWLEISYERIAEAVETNNIKQPDPLLFQEGAWFCGRKE